MKLVAARGRLMQALPGGAMLAVPLPEKEALEALDGTLSVAAVNAPSLCIVSGPGNEVQALEQRLARAGITSHRLNTSHAFHSAMMDPVVEPFARLLREEVELKPPHIGYVSNLTGSWITAAEATDPMCWARHLRQTVRFSDAAATLINDAPIFLEAGPGKSLCAVVRRQPSASSLPVLPSVNPGQDKRPDLAWAYSALGRLWLDGIEPDWIRVNAGTSRRRVSLPAYPFERQRYWIESRSRTAAVSPGEPSLEKCGDAADWLYYASWKRSAAPVPASARVRRPQRPIAPTRVQVAPTSNSTTTTAAGWCSSRTDVQERRWSIA